VPARAPERRWLKIAEGILSQPTAPCLEGMPAEAVRAFARRRGLGLSEDRWGNVVVKYPGKRTPKSPPLVLVAHLDHPGFVVESVRGRVAAMEFRGGVRRRHARRGTPVDFYRPGRTAPVGRGVLLSATDRGGRRPGFLARAKARLTSGTVEPGCFTMWRFPGYSVKGGKIVSRCLDDLLGAAAALAVLDELCRRRPRGAHVWGYFTRAEEIGLLGALAAIDSREVPRQARVLSLETSRTLPHAPQGGGVIVRVGDARSLFEPRLMGVLHRLAEAMARTDPDFRFQRRLMDGGSCEATAFCAAGYRAGGLAVPLGNYHNMKGLDGGEQGIGAESVAVADYVSEVKLLARLAEHSARLPRLEEATIGWLDGLTRTARATLGASP